MKQKTIVIVGGGYAGLHLVKGLKKELTKLSGVQIRLVLLDKNPYHFQKVLLFKHIVSDTELRIPFSSYSFDKLEFIQAEVRSIDKSSQLVRFKKDGEYETLAYDYLILAMGSIVRNCNELGGFALTDMDSAQRIRRQILEKIDSLHGSTEPKKKLKVSIAGGGITGIETASELAAWLKKESSTDIYVDICLINASEALLPHLPARVGNKAATFLNGLGVRLQNGKHVSSFKDGMIHYRDHTKEPSDICIWTTGLIPSPIISKLGLPTQPDGRLKVDCFYRVEGTENIYAVGDAALIFDRKIEKASRMTCKEGIDQASRLSKNIIRTIEGHDLIAHKHHPDFFCISLGPGNAIVWTKMCGVDFILTGKIGAKIRQFTWDMASMIKKRKEGL